jgi:methylthioribose-1-phosphate isomerase
MKFKTIEWKGDWVRILDQRKLPQEIHYLDCRDASSVAQAIRTMAIRGAPAIGVAAAMGIDQAHCCQPFLGRRSNEEDFESNSRLWC